MLSEVQLGMPHVPSVGPGGLASELPGATAAAARQLPPGASPQRSDQGSSGPLQEQQGAATEVAKATLL
jgi:hypothetical protein